MDETIHIRTLNIINLTPQYTLDTGCQYHACDVSTVTYLRYSETLAMIVINGFAISYRRLGVLTLILPNKKTKHEKCLDRLLYSKSLEPGETQSQVIGIPMGTNCAPLVADFFLYCYERDFMSSLKSDTQSDIIEALRLVFIICMIFLILKTRFLIICFSLYTQKSCV